MSLHSNKIKGLKCKRVLDNKFLIRRFGRNITHKSHMRNLDYCRMSYPFSLLSLLSPLDINSPVSRETYEGFSGVIRRPQSVLSNIDLYYNCHILIKGLIILDVNVITFYGYIFTIMKLTFNHIFSPRLTIY